VLFLRFAVFWKWCSTPTNAMACLLGGVKLGECVCARVYVCVCVFTYHTHSPTHTHTHLVSSWAGHKASRCSICRSPSSDVSMERGKRDLVSTQKRPTKHAKATCRSPSHELSALVPTNSAPWYPYVSRPASARTQHSLFRQCGRACFVQKRPYKHKKKNY